MKEVFEMMNPNYDGWPVSNHDNLLYYIVCGNRKYATTNYDEALCFHDSLHGHKEDTSIRIYAKPYTGNVIDNVVSLN